MSLDEAMGGGFDEWETPQSLFKFLHFHFKFTLDACASLENAKLPKFYTKEEDGLLQPWKGHRVWCNPPYSQLAEWLDKAACEAISNDVLSCMLIPNRTDTEAFYEQADCADQVVFLKGRVQFHIDGKLPKKRKNKHGKLVTPSNSHGSVLLVYGATKSQLFRPPAIASLSNVSIWDWKDFV